MSKRAAKLQKKVMSRIFRGKGIFKPLNTGFIDENVASLREWVANIFFYTKNGKTIMIDAGYNYDRLEEKMSWLNINPEEINHILITHQDTDHMGAVERDSALLFKNATLYIGEIENRYLTGEVRRKVFRGFYKLPKVTTDNKKVLLRNGQIFYIYDMKVECILVPGHTWGHMVYLIDDRYLFAGDTICFGADGGYSFIGALAEDNKLSIQSLNRLEMIVKGKQRDIKVITGHTGYTDDLLFAFAHIDKVCSLFSRKVFNPDAPYDGYDESDDTKENTEKSRQNMRRT
jgi:glyoxylase-like metal-dependent hydrolase (beta-lactamase superfamily II)